MKHALKDLLSRAANSTSAALAADAKDALWRRDRGVEAMTVAVQTERLGLPIVTSQQQAKRRSCVAGIHRLSIR